MIHGSHALPYYDPHVWSSLLTGCYPFDNIWRVFFLPRTELGQNEELDAVFRPLGKLEVRMYPIEEQVKPTPS